MQEVRSIPVFFFWLSLSEAEKSEHGEYNATSIKMQVIEQAHLTDLL
jgi:hypothetical protein